MSQLPWERSPTSVVVGLPPLASMEVAMEVAPFSSFIYFLNASLCLHLILWKLPPTSMEVGCKPAYMQVAPASIEAITCFHVLLLNSMEVRSRPTSMEVAPA